MPSLLATAAALALAAVTPLSGCGSGTTTVDDPTPATSPTSRSSTPAGPAGGDQAMALRAFARGGTGLPAVADQVELYLGNAFTGFATRAQAEDPTAWATCTEVGEYAGRACPLSALDVLAGHRAVAYVETPHRTCLQTYGPVPPDLRTLTRAAIVPAPGSVDSCIDDFAVQLFSNADGELVAVSLLLGEP
jgi:hypothetical protein